MKITVLGSGSKGNSTLVETTSCNILIDAGLSIKNIEQRLNNPLPKIDLLIITHTHIDHIKYINQIIKKHTPTVLTLVNDLETKITNQITKQEEYQINNLNIKLFKLSHDVDCCGILIKEKNEELVYITDTGYLSNKVLKQIKEKNIYIIESNHDEEMLRNGKYPFHLQQRIRSDKGHLSNDACANYLKKIIGENTKYIVLAHLSEENNTEKIVEQTINKMLTKTPNNINKIYIAKQDKKLETIEV